MTDLEQIRALAAQIFNGTPTGIEWATDQIVFPMCRDKRTANEAKCKFCKKHRFMNNHDLLICDKQCPVVKLNIGVPDCGIAFAILPFDDTKCYLV